MNIRVASPCSADWDKMSGNERVRNCTLCSLNVYNFAEMMRDEIRDLLLRTEGRVCGRLYRRADGTLLTRDCPTALQALRQRVSRFSSAVLATLFSFSAFGGNARETPQSKKQEANVEISIEQAVTPQRAMLTGVVFDEAGNRLPGVTLLLGNESQQPPVKTVTDANGAFAFPALDDGTYRVLALLDDFKPGFVANVALEQNKVARACITMRRESLITVTAGAVLVDSLWTSNEPLTTTFPQALVNKLPISNQR